MYQLQRGPREGCPSSCSVYNLGHNEALLALQRELESKGLKADGVHMRSCSELLPEYVRTIPEGEESQPIDTSTVCFADDTTILSTWKHSKEIEKAVLETEQRYGDAVHPGKTERMRIHPWNVPPPEGAEKSVRVLGSWIDCDGGAGTDS